VSCFENIHPENLPLPGLFTIKLFSAAFYASAYLAFQRSAEETSALLANKVKNPLLEAMAVLQMA
jgi:hypothetical protein